MLFIDSKYASMLNTYLRNFKQKKDYLWNFSCPICGDSSSHKQKARGYIYRKKNDLFVKCHNCGYGSNIGNFIKEVSALLYDEYVLERYKSGTNKHNSHKKPEEFDFFKQESNIILKDSFFDDVTCITDLPDGHPVLDYVKKRQIPENKFSNLFVTAGFKRLTNRFTFKFADEENDHPRLIIPFMDQHGKVFAFQGRAFGDEQPKYYTIKLEDRDKIYGLERVDWSKHIYVVEGPIDSLFLDNCLAVAGSSIGVGTIEAIKSNCTIVLDNEPRNKEICNILEGYIKNEFKVCLWPDTIKQKDINEMVQAGLSSSEIKTIIDENTYQGLAAVAAISAWRKC